MSGVLWDWDGWHDIGHGTEIVEQRAEDTGELVGVIERHECVDGILSGRPLPFTRRAIGTGDAPLWHVEDYGPLTIAPSVQCPACGRHGWIRGGEWVPAS